MKLIPPHERPKHAELLAQLAQQMAHAGSGVRCADVAGASRSGSRCRCIIRGAGDHGYAYEHHDDDVNGDDHVDQAGEKATREVLVPVEELAHI